MSQTHSRGIRKVRVNALLAFVCAVFLLASAVSINPINRAAERAADDLVASTTTTYIVLRLINASLSLVEAAHVQGTLAVVSAGVSPLKFVEPVDDTVERMATALFMVAAFSVLLSIAFNPVAAVGWAVLLAYFGLRAWTESRQRARSEQALPEVGGSRLPSYLLRTGISLSLVLPLAFVISVHLADLLTNSAWRSIAAYSMKYRANSSNRLSSMGRFRSRPESPLNRTSPIPIASQPMSRQTEASSRELGTSSGRDATRWQVPRRALPMWPGRRRPRWEGTSSLQASSCLVPTTCCAASQRFSPCWFSRSSCCLWSSPCSFWVL